ncbi:hypothetical protein M1105_10105 [Limibaculum sp. FT325]|uniref:RSP_7527 family protein n=1 Tax=Thermohalobaculum sediminis TaxID=2939436 RepID=UPI0020BDD616|nr:hypothetical protein [Limibaculum sediminis]MCL5777339.1 hypothetical protein [Limibaculum sediminis]
MTEPTSYMTARVPSADEIARIVARSRKLRAEALRDLGRAVWARIAGQRTAPQAPVARARHA